MGYIDHTLIKLRRTYSKDETISALYNKIDSLELENGKLTSEIHHLEHLNKEMAKNKEVNKMASLELRKEKLYKDALDRNKVLREKIKNLIHLRDSLFTKLNKESDKP